MSFSRRPLSRLHDTRRRPRRGTAIGLADAPPDDEPGAAAWGATWDEDEDVAEQPGTRAWQRWLAAVLAALLLWASLPALAQDGTTGGGSGSGSDAGGGSNVGGGDAGGGTGDDRSGGSRLEDDRTGGARDPSDDGFGSDRDRPTRRSRRDRTKRDADAATGAADQQAPAGATPRGLEQRSRVSAIRGEAIASLASRAPRTSIVFNYKLTERMAVLHFAPADMQLEEGMTARVALVCHNPASMAADRLRLGLRFNPDVLRLMRLDLMPIRPWLAREPDLRFDPVEGTLTLDAAFTRPVRFGPQPMITFEWKAVAAAPFQVVELLDVPDEERGRPWPSGLYLGARNLLGQRRIREDGIVPLGFEVLPAEAAAAGGGGAATALTLDEQVRLMNDPVVFGRGARGGIELELEAPEAVAVGEVFDVPVRFHNPRRSQLDSVRLAIAFDPAVLEAVDHDARNAITLGLNVQEGDRRAFPFDYHIENAADNGRGLVSFRMGIGGDAQLPVEGVIATLRLRARRAATRTTLRFVEPSAALPGTRVTFLGRDVLGDADAPADGLYGTSLTIR